MGNQDKDRETSNGATAMGDLTSPRDACQAAQDLGHERKARDAALAKQVAKAVAKGDGQGSCALPGLTQ